MAGILETIRAGFAKELTGSSPVAVGNQSLWWWTPAGALDYSGIGDGGGNSAVFACIRVKAKGFTEAPARVYRRVDQQWVEQPAHPIQLLLAKPNPYMSSSFIGAYTMWSIDIAGDAYFAKVRSNAGVPIELWPLRPDLVEPLSGQELSPSERATLNIEPNAFIGAYRYTVNGHAQLFAATEIVHLKDMPDPVDMRHGAAAIKTVLREILADEEAGQFAAALVKNMGVPGVILTPKDADDPGPDAEAAAGIKARFKDSFGGSNRGEPMVISGGPMDVNVVSFSPEQLDFKTVRRLPEERIAAVTGVPAILAGLGAGLDRSTYANWQQARESLAEDTLSPLWETFGVQWTHQLGPDFGLAPTEAVRYDTSDVRALQDDENKTVERMNVAVSGGWAMVAEARAEAGLPVDPSHEVFLRSAGQIEVPAGDMSPFTSGNGSRDDADVEALLT